MGQSQGAQDKSLGLYEIKETENAAKEERETSEQKPRKQTDLKPSKIADAKKWVAPPKLKSLKSNKVKKGQKPQ